MQKVKILIFYSIVLPYFQAKEDGKEIGKEENLISQIMKKRMKNYDIKTVADHIEMDEEYVSKVFTILNQHPEYGEKDVLGELMGKNSI